MKYPPFLTSDEAPEELTATAEIVQFPRHVVARAELRAAQRHVAKLEQKASDNDMRSRDVDERIRAIGADVALEYWRPQLRDAEAAVAMLDADDTLTFRGQAYRARRGFHGAN